MQDRPLLRLVAIASLVVVTACEGGTAECTSSADCGASDSACEKCPPTGARLCVEEACVDRGDDEVDVIATFNLDRNIADDVVSIVHVVATTVTADGTALDCASAFENDVISPRVATLSAGFKALSGGSFHPDVNLGRAPNTGLALLVLAVDDDAGKGNVIAKGCSAQFTSGDIVEVDP